ncbi:hypothetical protein [Lysinibacillus sp. NPDC056185]|uniref:hypothetical protein n=1 Tax=Lysinibacillus sp. NPDC056185 TaxID=3345739 RepID=UPI0039EEF3A1
MSNSIKKVDFKWRFDSCGDPYFKLTEKGLEVNFAVYLGIEEERIEINSLLKKYGFEFDTKITDHDSVYNSIFSQLDKQGLEGDIQLLDSIFNHAGSALVYFNFTSFDYVFYSSEEEIIKKYSNFAPIFHNIRGLYEEINSQGERNYYVFVGHDSSLVIKTSKEYSSLYIKKFSEINGL